MSVGAYAKVLSIEGTRPIVITMEAIKGDLVHPWPPPRQNLETDALTSNREGVLTKATFVVEMDADVTALQVGALITWNSQGWQGILAP